MHLKEALWPGFVAWVRAVWSATGAHCSHVMHACVLLVAAPMRQIQHGCCSKPRWSRRPAHLASSRSGNREHHHCRPLSSSLRSVSSNFSRRSAVHSSHLVFWAWLGVVAFGGPSGRFDCSSSPRRPRVCPLPQRGAALAAMSTAHLQMAFMAFV